MTLTDLYLASAATRGPRPSDLQERAREAVTDTMYFGRCLSRPAFLARDDFRRLHGDLEVLLSALTRLPERVFGGDLVAFARAAGLKEPQARAVARGRGSAPSRLSRADIYRDATGFRLLEINMGSNIGGLDNAVLNEVMLEDPFISEFVAEHGLSYVDTMAELAQSVLIEAKVPTGVRPYVAVVDTAENFSFLEAALQKSARILAPLGLDCRPAPLDRLEYRDDRVWLDGRPVDVVYRLFGVEEVLKPGVEDLIEPLLLAVERGHVSIFTALDSDLFGSKGALAVLSDEAYRDRYPAGELAVLDRFLPWTRIVRPGSVTVHGRSVDLTEYAVSHRTELVLKPVAEHGGQGVVLGWETDESTWAARLQDAMDLPYVIQERVHPVAELFPTDEGGVEPWVLSWGAILVARGYGGMFVRGTQDLQGGLVSMLRTATATCTFHQP